MSRFVDSIIAYRILRMLVTPFEETDAYRLGIIDKYGKELKKMNQLNTVDERDAYSILHRMIFRLKKIINKVPIENKKLLNFAAALSLIKENYYATSEPIDLELQFITRRDLNFLEEDVTFIQDFIHKDKILGFKHFTEDAPVNNAAATPGVDGLTSDTVVVNKRARRKIMKRQEVKNAIGIN